MKHLSGAVGRVRIGEHIGEGVYSGTFRGNIKTKVIGGGNYSEALARFSYPRPNELTAHFLTSSTAGVSDLVSEGGYSLVAHWSKELETGRVVPSFLEIYRHFNPSYRLNTVVYLKPGHSRHGGRFRMIGAGKLQKCHSGSIGSLLKNHTCRNGEANLVLTETTDDLKETMNNFVEFGILPIELDPIKIV